MGRLSQSGDHAPTDVGKYMDEDRMTPYDRKAWSEIETWRERRASARTRRAFPSGVVSRVSAAGSWVRGAAASMPGAAQFEAALSSALSGLTDLGSRAASASVRDEAVLKAFRKRGHEVHRLSDVRALDLRDIDDVRPNLGLYYTAGATASGAASGFAVSGGEALAAGGSVLGAGAGGVAGAGVLAGALAADAAATLLAAQRAVGHTAAYYGYDVDEPDERLISLSVLSMATADQASKAAAYVQLNKLVQELARRATWEQLNQHVVTVVMRQVYTRLGFRLTQRKLGQAVPVLGIALGAGLNARMLSTVIDDAHHFYRERFLKEKYGLGELSATIVASQPDEDVIDVAQILEAEIIDEGRGGPDN